MFGALAARRPAVAQLGISLATRVGHLRPTSSSPTNATREAAPAPVAPVELGEVEKSEMRFTKDHEWARITPDGLATLGISMHAAKALGDVVFVESPNEGCKIKAGDNIGAVESVKAASEIYSPVSGHIWATNKILGKKPQLIGTHPYCAGWFCKVKFSDERELEKLMSWAEYEAYTGASKKQ